MIKTINNFSNRFFSPKSRKDVPWYSDRVILSGPAEEPDFLRKPVFKEITATCIDELIKKQARGVERLKRELSLLYDSDEKCHKGFNVTGESREESLRKIHGLIKKRRRELEKEKYELKKLKLEKMKPFMNSLPEDVVNYFYAAERDFSPLELQKVGDLYRGLNSKENSLISRGNSIVPLEESEVWQEMVNLLDIPEGSESLEIDLQYYLLGHRDIYEKLKKNLREGHRVRVFLDPGRGFETSKKDGTADGRDILRLLKTLEDLFSDTEGMDLGISLAAKKDPYDIMHRKLLRVGEKVFTGGMNGDTGSGENADYGVIVEGPAAREMGKNFIRDIEKSMGKSPEEILGRSNMDILKKGYKETLSGKKTKYDIELSSRDFFDFITMTLPEESRRAIKSSSNVLDRIKNLFQECEKHNIFPGRYGIFHDFNGDSLVDTGEMKAGIINRNPGFKIKLTLEGRKLLCHMVEKAFSGINSKENREILKNTVPPAGNPAGSHEIFAAHSPEELQAMVIHAINSAEDFLYIPAYFITEDIAKLIVRKKKAGDIDIRVIMEPAQIPDINLESYLLLEDAKIPVRWALLPGSSSGHNRKLHSKMLVSDKTMVTGSTNLTWKGLTENWETGLMVFTDEANPESTGKRDEYKRSFCRIWDEETLPLNTEELAVKACKAGIISGDDISKEEYRRYILKKVLRGIDRYEKETGEVIEGIISSKPAFINYMEYLKGLGIHEGYAGIMTLERFYSPEDIRVLKLSTFAGTELFTFAGGVVKL